MAIQIIGKSVLGEEGFYKMPSDGNYNEQLSKIKTVLPTNRIIMTPLTNQEEITLLNGYYIPKLLEFNSKLELIFDPKTIILGQSKFLPTCDFIMWNVLKHAIVAATFSREAPILAFESSTGKRALGTVSMTSLLRYGDYLFSLIREFMKSYISVELVTYNEGLTPDLICKLAHKYEFQAIIKEEAFIGNNPECFQRGEAGNHVVAMW